MTENLETNQSSKKVVAPITSMSMKKELIGSFLGERAQEQLPVAELKAQLEEFFNTINRVATNLDIFFQANDGYDSQLMAALSKSEIINLNSEDLTLLEELQTKVGTLSRSEAFIEADYNQLKDWLLASRILELITGTGIFSPDADIQHTIKLLLTSSSATARGLMGADGALIKTVERYLDLTAVEKEAETQQNQNLATAQRKTPSLRKKLAKASAATVIPFLLTACRVKPPITVEPTPVVTEKKPEEDATLVPEIKPEPEETPNADDELTATTEITATETITPTGFIYTGLGIGGAEINPIATEITPENKNAIEIQEPLLVELMASEIKWQDGTKIVGFMYQNDIRARVTEGGSVDGNIQIGDVLFLSKEGLKIDHDFEGREGEVVDDGETFNSEEEMQTIKDRLAIMSQDLVEASLILRPAESGKQEFVLQAGDEEMVIGTLGFNDDDQAVLVRGENRYPMIAVEVDEGKLILGGEVIVINESPTPSVTVTPTSAPTATQEPTLEPTVAPTATQEPTLEPTSAPTATQEPTLEPTVAPTAVPEQPTQPEQAPPPILANQEPTLEQIAYYCTGYFEPSALPPHGLWGLVENIQGTTVTIGGQTIDVANTVQITVHKIFDRAGFAAGINNAHELYTIKKNINEVLPYIKIGSHLWIADAPIGRTLRTHCSAIK